MDKSTAIVVRWLRQNQNRFQMEVMEPACLSVEVKDPDYANAVEAAFNGQQLRVGITPFLLIHSDRFGCHSTDFRFPMQGGLQAIQYTRYRFY